MIPLDFFNVLKPYLILQLMTRHPSLINFKEQNECSISNWNNENILATDIIWILEKEDTSYLYDFELFPAWLFQYFNELLLVESIKSAYFVWKSKQHRLAPKYDIMCSLELLVKHYFMTMEEDDNKLKITCQSSNDFVTCSGRSGYQLYITFLHSGFSTLRPYHEELVQDLFFVQ